jgi:DNA-binding PadR family transcriptional regulator
MPLMRSPLTIEHALLGFLRQQPIHGYEIYQQLEKAKGMGLVWHIKQSQLYALLTKLEKLGYITATLEPQDARPPRKIFHVTPAGREAFLRWVQSPVKSPRKLRLEFLAKLYFAQQEAPTVVSRLIEQQRVACRTWLTGQHRQAETAEEPQPFDELVHEFRLGQLEAMLNWLDKCEEVLLIPASG